MQIKRKPTNHNQRPAPKRNTKIKSWDQSLCRVPLTRKKKRKGELDLKCVCFWQEETGEKRKKDAGDGNRSSKHIQQESERKDREWSRRRRRRRRRVENLTSKGKEGKEKKMVGWNEVYRKSKVPQPTRTDSRRSRPLWNCHTPKACPELVKPQHYPILTMVNFFISPRPISSFLLNPHSQSHLHAACYQHSIFPLFSFI